MTQSGNQPRPQPQQMTEGAFSELALRCSDSGISQAEGAGCSTPYYNAVKTGYWTARPLFGTQKWKPDLYSPGRKWEEWRSLSEGVGQLLKEKTLSVILTENLSPEDLLGPCLITMHWSPKETASSSAEKRFPLAPQHLPHLGMNNTCHQTFERECQKPKWESRTKRNLQESETVWNMYEHPENDVIALGVREVRAPTEQEQHAIKSRVLWEYKRTAGNKMNNQKAKSSIQEW